jgi:hypothetical protein
MEPELFEHLSAILIWGFRLFVNTFRVMLHLQKLLDRNSSYQRLAEEQKRADQFNSGAGPNPSHQARVIRRTGH